MDDIFQRFDRPYPSLTEFLEALLQTLLGRYGLQAAEVELADGARLAVRRPLGRPARRGRSVARSVDDAVRAAEWLEVTGGAMRRGRERRPASIALRLSYAGRDLGVLRLTWQAPGGRGKPSEAVLADLADRLARLVHRYQAGAWAAASLGAPLTIVGMSRALQETEALLETIAGSELPVLLQGEFGTEATHFAAMIHAGGGRRGGPFLIVNAADPDDAPAAWFKQAQGGTLFLDSVESLSPELQNALDRQLHSVLLSWPPRARLPNVRVIALTSADMRSEVAAGRFARGLLAKLDVLSLRIPPLRERPEDVPALVDAVLARQGFASEAKGGTELLAALEDYAWPENLLELERVVTRLAVMTGDRPIREADVLRLTPWVSRAWRSPEREAAAFQAAREVAATTGKGERWVQSVLARDPQQLARLHEGLRRALLWLADHSAEPVSLERLAREAHVSPSHLTFLFRENLGLPFKALLTGLRIERAKQIFAETPGRRVTEVAMTVGFSDLSHFERTFRRLAGQSPREYRRAAEARSTPLGER